MLSWIKSLLTITPPADFVSWGPSATTQNFPGFGTVPLGLLWTGARTAASSGDISQLLTPKINFDKSFQSCCDVFQIILNNLKIEIKFRFSSIQLYFIRWYSYLYCKVCLFKKCIIYHRTFCLPSIHWSNLDRNRLLKIWSANQKWFTFPKYFYLNL